MTITKKPPPPGHVALEAYLVFNKTTITKMAKAQPSLGPGERQCKLRLEVPLHIFETPEFSVTVQLAAGTTPYQAQVVMADAADILGKAGISAKIVPLFADGSTACEDCDGTGDIDLGTGEPTECAICHGTGKIRKTG